jgi:hypothetical protein
MKHCYILLRRKQQHLLHVLVFALFIHNLLIICRGLRTGELFYYTKSYIYIYIYIYIYYIYLVQQPNSGVSRFMVEVYTSHTVIQTHTRQDSSQPVISSWQRPLPTHHTTNTREQNPCPKRNSNPPSQESSGCLRPHDHRDWLKLHIAIHIINIK